MSVHNSNLTKCLVCGGDTSEEKEYDRTFFKCNSCQFVFAKDFDPNIIIKGMGMEGSWSGPGGGGYREYFLAKMLAKELNLKSFLLFGTGNTTTFSKLLNEGFDVIGCDISKDVVDYKKKSLGSNLFFTPDALPKDKKYDAIIAVEVIEHFHEPYTSFNRLFEVLNSKGIICGTTDYFIGESIHKSDTTNYMKIKGHVAYWNNHSLSIMAKQYGYVVNEFEMIRPGSVLPDEKFGKLWPNKRVFFIFDPYFEEYFLSKKASSPILPIDNP